MFETEELDTEFEPWTQVRRLADIPSIVREYGPVEFRELATAPDKFEYRRVPE